MEDQTEAEEQEKQENEVVSIKKEEIFSKKTKVIFTILLLVSLSLGVLSASGFKIDGLKQIFNKEDTALSLPEDDSHLLIHEESPISMEIIFRRDGEFWVHKDGVEEQITNHKLFNNLDDESQKMSYITSYLKLSPDRKKISYVKEGGYSEPSELIIANLDGSDKSVVTEKIGDNNYVWSKDSQKIYFVSWDVNEKDRLEYASSHEGEAALLTNIISVDISTKEETKFKPVLSQDGCGGSFGQVQPGLEILIVNRIRKISSDTIELSDNGEYLHFTSSCTGIYYLLNLKTGEQKSTKDLNELEEKILQEIVKTNNSNQCSSINDKGENFTYFIELGIASVYEVDYEIACNHFGGCSIEEKPQPFNIFKQILYKNNVNTDKTEKIAVFDAYYANPIYLKDNKMILVIVENNLEYLEELNKGKSREELTEYYPQMKVVELNLSDLSYSVILENFYYPLFYFE